MARSNPSIPEPHSGTSPHVQSSHNSPPPLDLAALPRLSVSELQKLWPIYMGRARCPVQRRIIVRELAWRYQERLYGGLDPETKRLLEAAVRAAIKRRSAKQPAPVEPGHSPPPPSRRSPAANQAKHTLRQAPAGARLVRAWPPGSKTVHEVHILDNGKVFEYRGTKYKSLSEIARVITGTRWSGPRFFGLAGRRNGQEGGEA